MKAARNQTDQALARLAQGPAATTLDATSHTFTWEVVEQHKYRCEVVVCHRLRYG